MNDVYVEVGDDFQEYVYDDGSDVKVGTLVGYEMKDKEGNWKLVLRRGVYYK